MTTSPINPKSEHDPTVERVNGARGGQILRSPPDFEVMFPIRRYLGLDGTVSNDPGLEPSLLKRMMRFMIWNRELDDRLTKLQRQGRIGFHIGSVGEEALMIGSAAAARPSDWVVPCYREAGVALYRGFPVEQLVANMFGTADDPVQGRQMPCHYADREHNFLSISSPVGTQIPQAAGIAWGMKLRKTSDVAIVYFGDGATSQGDFHVGLNFAGVFKLPVVFICRNNQWAISTPFEVQTAAKTIAQKSVAYGIAGERVDGNDALAAYSATKDAIDRARRGEGATLLEMYSYRQGAHSTSDDPRAYRQQAEVDAWIQKDPLTRLRRYLVAKGLWSDAEDEASRSEIIALLAAAIDRAEKAPRPAIASIFEDVFETKTAALAEQQAALEAALAAGE